MISAEEAERIVERVGRLGTEKPIPKPPKGTPPLPREMWLKNRAKELTSAIQESIGWSDIIGNRDHDLIQKWIDELQDLWQLIEE